MKDHTSFFFRVKQSKTMTIKGTALRSFKTLEPLAWWQSVTAQNIWILSNAAVTTATLIQTQVCATRSIWKVADSNYLLCRGSPSEWNKLTTAGQIFVKFYIGREGTAICRENWSVVENGQKSTAGGIFNSQVWQLICCLLLLCLCVLLHCNFQVWTTNIKQGLPIQLCGQSIWSS